jgi:hypothetical protein
VRILPVSRKLRGSPGQVELSFSGADYTPERAAGKQKFSRACLEHARAVSAHAEAASEHAELWSEHAELEFAHAELVW